MTSEVKADLKIELRDLNYLSSHASLASKCFPEMIPTDGANYDPLTCVALPQVKRQAFPRLPNARRGLKNSIIYLCLVNGIMKTLCNVNK